MRLRRTGTIPADARVRHYDELDEETQVASAKSPGGREQHRRPRTSTTATW